MPLPKMRRDGLWLGLALVLGWGVAPVRADAAFAASCEHELRFWDAAYAARAPRPA